MKIKDIIRVLEDIAPPQLQESYDNAGLITGDNNWEVSNAMISLDATEAIVDEAIAKNANLIIAHHPIVFGGLKKITGRNYVERTIIKAIKNDIAIYAIHTNLDNIYRGVNRKLGEKLGLVNLQILSPKTGVLKKLVTFCPNKQANSVREAIFSAGAGQIADYDFCSFNVEGVGTFRADDTSQPYVGKPGSLHQEPEVRIETVFPSYMQHKVIAALLQAHPYEEVAYDVYSLDNKHERIGAGMIGDLQEELVPEAFLKHLKQSMNLQSIRYTQTYRKSIKRVAICGGSGSFLLGDALQQQADAFVTADFKYHQFFDAEEHLMIADIGHYESEFYTIELISELIQEKLPNFVPIFPSTDTNPVKYY